MEIAKNKMGFKGDIKAFFEFIRLFLKKTSLGKSGSISSLGLPNFTCGTTRALDEIITTNSIYRLTLCSR